MKTIPVNLADGQTPEILIYGVIGEDLFEEGITAKGLAEALAEIPLTHSSINVRINSPGGYGFEGDAMYNLLKRDPRQIHVSIDGLAASAASEVAMAGDRIAIAENAMIMVHKTWMITLGNVDDHQKSVDLLAKLDKVLAGIYAKRTGRRPQTWMSYMQEETWFNAAEALDAKLVDEVTEAGEVSACADERIAAGWQRMPAAAAQYVVDRRRLDQERQARARRVAARMRQIDSIEAALSGGV